MFTLHFLLFLALTVIICALPSGYLFMAIQRDQDPRTVGSGNTGMSNVWRMGGASLGLLTLAADMGKGYLCISWAQTELGTSIWPIGLLAAAAILSHCYSCYIDFTGGKGVAVAGGIFLALTPTLFVILLAIWMFITLLTKHPSLGSLVCCLSIIPLVLLIAPQWVGLTGFAALLVAYRHHSNIRNFLPPELNNRHLAVPTKELPDRFLDK